MSDLLQLSAPWWHFVLRALVIYLLVIGLIRVSGKRAVGQFTPFDLVLLILIGNAVQNGLNGGDNSLTGAFILAACLVALNYAVAWASARWHGFERWIEGDPVVLARNGEIFENVLKRELVSHEDLREALRINNIAHVGDIGVAILETNGSISVLPRESLAASQPLHRPHHRRRKRRPQLPRT
ncbi:DUF421 domain-containing protein [Lysobacter pythonis]|uniref:DUF421 domain-containing protein n=1 Tax=Solilutibacter pythonis TaxID=2483112 RepID=A0A3M2I3V8_9GAMM|nr:YetF domain-containing protein [Lysobacter pythonis]RMH93177.1 DUF421 domain-containing protein [Lysobacter pythonis]